MKKIKLKLTALTPIHIGTGESYEPTNFVIDNGYLYEFDEFKFFEDLDEKQKKEFLIAVESKSNDSLFRVYRIIKNNKEIAKKHYIHKVQVSKSVENAYKNKVGRVVQQEGGRKKPRTNIFNQFAINKTSRLTNGFKVYIPGSSLKGALLTAIDEFIYKKDLGLWRKLFNDCMPYNDFMKSISVADSTPIKTFSIIGWAVNKERFEDDKLGPSVLLETIYSDINHKSQFETTIDLKNEFCDLEYFMDIKEIQKACNEHYLPIFRQQFNSKALFKGRRVDEWTNKYFSKSFYNKYKNFQLKDNQFLIRVGKYSQARAVTVDGMRRVKVKISGDRWKTLDQETTTWMFSLNEKSETGLMPFGWVLCEIL